MKMISGLGQFQPPVPRGSRTIFFGLLLIAALLVDGCNKSKPVAVQAPPPDVDTNQPVAAAPRAPEIAPAPVVIPASPDGGADLKVLNHAYISWIVQNRQRPKDLADYLARSGVQLPPPPAGKKYVIDSNGFINYANN